MANAPDTPTANSQSPRFARSELRYDLPDELIAQTPSDRRDGARLLLIDRSSGQLRDAGISDLIEQLRPGDLLILNDTKVLPAKLKATRRTGGIIRGLFEREVSPAEWEVMLAPSKRLRTGEILRLQPPNSAIPHESLEPLPLTLESSLGDGRWLVRVASDEPAHRILDRYGRTPLPPYIRRTGDSQETETGDSRRYQTVYARSLGAIAAPTAGLHLTTRMLDQLEEHGIQSATVTLHIGAGTFSPVRAPDLAEHTMHTEWYDLPETTANAIKGCRSRGGRVVAVGTTAVRVLETCADPSSPGTVRSGNGQTDIFIYPSYEFYVVDAMLTNFHLPESTLLALVMAFCGIDNIRRAYRHAISQRYRFFSFGDAMLIQ